MMRSTELWEMSRSCHSATFSKAASHVRTHQAGQAADLLAVTGLRLCGIAEAAALLSTERLFGFAHFGALQVANFERDFSSVAAMSASALRYCAWRSR